MHADLEQAYDSTHDDPELDNELTGPLHGEAARESSRSGPRKRPAASSKVLPPTPARRSAGSRQARHRRGARSGGTRRPGLSTTKLCRKVDVDSGKSTNTNSSYVAREHVGRSRHHRRRRPDQLDGPVHVDALGRRQDGDDRPELHEARHGARQRRPPRQAGLPRSPGRRGHAAVDLPGLRTPLLGRRVRPRVHRRRHGDRNHAQARRAHQDERLRQLERHGHADGPELRIPEDDGLSRRRQLQGGRAHRDRQQSPGTSERARSGIRRWGASRSRASTS